MVHISCHKHIEVKCPKEGIYFFIELCFYGIVRSRQWEPSIWSDLDQWEQSIRSDLDQWESSTLFPGGQVRRVQQPEQEPAGQHPALQSQGLAGEDQQGRRQQGGQLQPQPVGGGGGINYICIF